MAVLVVVAYVGATTGCLSNEYVIAKPELQRLSAVPAPVRGQSVRVLQKMGSRRDPPPLPVLPLDHVPIDDETILHDNQPGRAYAEGSQDGTSVSIDLPFPHGREVHVARGGAQGPRPVGGGRPATIRPIGTAHAGPRHIGRASGGGGGVSRGGGGGGGGGGIGNLGQDLEGTVALVALVVVAIAVMAAVGATVTEGLRYDGQVSLHSNQPIYLSMPDGSERQTTLAALTTPDAEGADEAIVKDDDGYDVAFLGRRPLDRKGFAFKVDLGSVSAVGSRYSLAGISSNIQLGYFPHHRIGLLGTLSLAGGDGVEGTFQRHSANVEAQVFPIDSWRLHLGGFAHAGSQFAADHAATRSGPAFGGGALLEVALTTRLALGARFDYTTARTALDGGWAQSLSVTFGVAVY